jgi:hypothetical protein
MLMCPEDLLFPLKIFTPPDLVVEEPEDKNRAPELTALPLKM